MAATYYTPQAQGMQDAKLNAFNAVTYKNEKFESQGVITLSGASVVDDLHMIEWIQSGAIMDWAGASIVSTNAALAGTIGLVNAAGVFTPYATLTAATNLGRATAPTNISFDPIAADCWVAYKLGSSPPTSGTALIRVPRTVLSC